MPTPIQPNALLNNIYQWLTAAAPSVRNANQLNGGGGYENWAVVQYLLNLTGAGDFDYRREAPVGRMRIDIAFNLGQVAPLTPAILTEWKCNPSANTLSVGCTGDIEKFVDVLEALPVAAVLPLPMIIGVGPAGAGFPGYSSVPIPDAGLSLYLSTATTWATKGVLDKTWYSQNPTAPGDDLSHLPERPASV